MATKKVTAAEPPVDAPSTVHVTVLDVLKHDGEMYGPAGNAAGWPDQVELTPAQAVHLAAAGVVTAPAELPAD